VSGAADPTAQLEQLIGAMATFTDLRALIAASSFSADALGDDWPSRFRSRSQPYLKFALAPRLIP
jgi:hypothetical protein